ncbi:acetate--CoA ligase family protein, partial [Nonomuraea guangzhouensis]
QAGPGLLLLDDLRGRRANIPELTTATRDALAELLPPLTYQANPVDTGRPGPALGRILAAVGADPGVDMIAAYTLYEPDAVDIVTAVKEGHTRGTPMVLGLGGTGEEVVRKRRELLEAGVAVTTDPRGVAAATAALLADARARAHTAAPSPEGGRVPADVRGRHDEHQAKNLLARIGVRTMPHRACDARADARAVLAELGGPVAVKLLDAEVLHKTEIGGVYLNVATRDELEAALDRLDAAGARRYLLEKMAPAGVDLIVGVRRDPVFGPVVLVGLGGTVAEALADVAVRLAPLTPAEAVSMPSELTGHALLTGWRSGPVLDSGELSRIVAALGDLLTANPLIDEIEINPLRLTADGLVALDAVIIPLEADDAQPHL